MKTKQKKRIGKKVVRCTKSRIAGAKSKSLRNKSTSLKKVMLIMSISLLVLSIVQSFAMITITGKTIGTVSLTIETPPAEITACNINLTTNYGRWNYVSSPIYLASNQVRSALSDIDGFYDWVFEYDHSDGFFDYYFYLFDTGTMSGIYVGNCYIIKAKANTTLSFNGTSEFTNISKAFTTNFGRWNYIGWVNESTDIATALNSIDGDYDWVFRYDSTTGEFEYYFSLFGSGPLQEIDPCECYIIKAKNNVTLNYAKS